MAAVAGAPGPGEGGESEQDSETIPGERRLGRLSCEPMEAELDSERRSLVRCEPCCGMEIDTQENAGPDIEQLGDSGAEQPRLCECRGDGLGPAGRDDRDVGEETMQVVDEHVMASKPVEMESQSCPENFLQTQSSEQSISAFSQGAAVEQECISEEHSEASHTALHPPEPELQMYVPQLEESEFQQLQMHSDVLQPPYTDILQMPGDVSQLPEPDAQQLQVHSEVPQALEPELQQLHMHGNVSQPPEPEFQQQESYVPQPPEPEVQHQEMYGGVPRPLELEVQQQEMYGDVSQPAALEVQPLKQELDQVQKIVVQQDMQQELPISLQVMQVQDTEHICVNYKPLNGPVPEETVSGGFIAQEPLSIGEVLLKEALFVEKGVSGEALSVGDTKVLSVGDIRSESIGQAGPEETISIIKTNHGEALSLREEGPGDTIPLFNKGFNDPPSMQKSSFGEILPIQTDYAEELLPIRENRPAEGSLSGALLDQRGNIATEKDTEESPDVGYTTCGVKSAAGKVLSQEELVPEIAKEQAATESLPVIETISGEVLAVQEPFTMVSLTQQKGLDVTPIKQSGLLKICALETQPQGSQKNFPSDSEHLLEEAQEEPLSKGLHLEKVEPTFQEAQNTHVPESCSLPQNCIPDDQHIKELVPECQRTQKPANVQGPVSGDILQPDKESMELYQQHSLEFIGAHHNRLLPVDVQTSSESFSETKQYIGGPVSEKNQKVQNEEPGPDSINLKVSSVETESSLDAVCGAGNMGQEMDSLSKSLGIPNHISFERDHLSPLFIVQSDGRNVSCLENKKTHELCMTVDTFLKTYPNKLGEENNTKNITCRLEIVSDNPELQSDQLSKDMAMETINGSDSENVAFAHELIPTDKPVTEDTVLNLEPIPLETAVVPGPTSIKTVYGIHTNSEFVSVSAVDYMGINQGQIAPENRKARSEQLPREPFLQRQPIPMILSEVTDSGIYTGLCLEEAKFSSNNGSEASLNYSECDNRSVGTTEGSVVTSGIDSLIPGSEVQVTLDHIIQDALVVSFCHGNRIFSGVLMDLSKRFGPHGIPVTVHPRREYKNKPVESIQEESKSFHEEPLVKSEENSPEDVTPIQQLENCKVQNLWTTKPPPLFHEGAPYPPPLFIRDTYNQSIPQPPPRKIKRPKKKIYREEPTSIMNAIKLRPRQVLCDKCKNNVVADKKEIRKVATDSYKTEEGKRRRHETVTTVNKKLKTDHKVNGKSQNESQKRTPITKVTNLAHGRGKVVKVPSQTSAAKTQMHTKKVLQNKNMDHVKAREVLKMAKEKAQKKQKVTTSSKNAHSKVHFTRRLQNSSSGTLPPRLRIKPQRYRNEENDSSLKPGLETLRSSKIGIKPQTRYSATRSAGETPSEIQSPSNGPEEISSEMQDTNVCVPPEEQDLQQTLGKRGSKSNITVYMTINQKKANSSSASVCSSDSTDDMKSSHSECSSTENFDFPPGSMHAPSSSSSSSASSKEEKKLSNSLKIKMFSKNVSKCVTPDGRTICVGDIVWAKIYGFPWWPARILAITVSRKDTGLLVRQEARISWFGSPTTSFLALSQLTPFLENFQSRFNKKRKGLYRKAITEAAKAAKQLTPEVRALLTQFET